MAEILQKLESSPDLTLAQRIARMDKYDRMNKLCQQMADVIQNADTVAFNFVNKAAQNVFLYNYNFFAAKFSFSLLDNTAVKNILTNQVNPFTKLSFEDIKDKRTIMRKLRSELTTGILKGESIPKIARRIKNVSEGHLKNTVRIARTETLRVENSARQSICEEGLNRGLNMWKRWVATNDDRTRDAHMAADGQEVQGSQPFIVDGEKLMHPGDISLGASAGNVINCRCTEVPFLKR